MTTTEFFAGFDSPQNMAMVDIHYDADGSLYVLSLQFKDANDYRVDPDGTRNLLTDVILTKIANNEIVFHSVIDTTYSGNDETYGSSSVAIGRGALQVTDNVINIFIQEKTATTSHYGQNGFLYHLDKETLTPNTSREVLFTEKNWGAHPYFDTEGNVHHFAYAGYYEMVNTTQIGSMDPGDSAKLQWENHIQTDDLNLDINTLESWEQLSEAMVAKAMEVIDVPDITAPTILTQTIIGGSSGSDGLNDIQKMADGNLLIAGSFYTTNLDALLTAVTPSGETIWAKTYGGSDYDVFSSLEFTSDGGYIMGGESASYGAYRSHQYVVKTDSDGNEKWMHVYGGVDCATGGIVTPTTDGGYIVTGNSTETDAWWDIRLTKVGTSGNEEWIKFFGRSLDDSATDVIQTSDGGYVITGYSGGHSSSTPMWIIKTDSNGNQLWNKLIGGTGAGGIEQFNAWDIAYEVQEMSDNSLVVAGRMYNGSNAQDAVLLKLDSTGNTLWTRYYGGTSNEQFNDFVQLSNGGFALVGSTESYGNGSEVFLVTTDSEGNETGHLTFGGTGTEYGNGITLLSDTVVAIAGSTQAEGSSTSDGLLATVSLTGADPDTTAPTLTSSTPSDDATSVAVDSNITLTFNENVQAGTGNVMISNGTDIRSIDVTDSAQVIFEGDTIIINPTDDLQAGTSYHVAMESGVIKDMGGNAYEGISDATALNFSTINSDADHHDLTGHITFWKTGEAITDVTTTLTALATDGTHAIEFRNIHVAADGSHTVEVWKTATEGNIGSVEFECVLSTSASATWQDAKELPNGWSSYASPNESGNYGVALMAGISLGTLGEGAVKLGTLTIAEPAPSNHFELLLASGMVGDNNVQGFGIASDSASTGNDNYYHYINIADSTYALTADKVAGEKEASAIHANDAYAALKMAVSLNPNGDGSAVLPYQYLAADINHDGKVRANDAFNILKMAVGVASAPAEEWIFVSEAVADKTMDRSHVDWSDLAPTIDFNNTAIELDLIGIVKGDVDGSWGMVG